MPKATMPWPPKSGPLSLKQEAKAQAPKAQAPKPPEPAREPVDKRSLQSIVLQSLRGKPVSVAFTDGAVTNGTLVSSDVYTLLVRYPDGEALIFKHGIRSVRLNEGTQT